MTGTLEPEDAIRIYANNYTPSEEDNRMTTALNYPQWFMEGSASAMEKSTASGSITSNAS